MGEPGESAEDALAGTTVVYGCDAQDRLASATGGGVRRGAPATAGASAAVGFAASEAFALGVAATGLACGEAIS